MAPTRLDPLLIIGNSVGKKKDNDGFLTDDHFPISVKIRSDSIENDYNIDARPFARGKYAQVRRCRHKKTGIEYAAKVMKRRRRTTDVRHEIMHEIRVLLMAADNDRIVKLHEIFETPTEYILLLEMAEGGELQRVLDEEDSIPEQQVINLIKQLLEAIRFLHDNNIAHLDIKPQNILLSQRYPHLSIKLCDFGISRLIADDSELREIVGTPDYVAPEILHYEPISLATDMWSVGVLAYVLLSGYSPFGGETKQETFHNITNQKLEFPNEHFVNVSDSAKDFISKLLHKKSTHRMTYRECLEHEWLTKQSSNEIIEKPSLTLIDNVTENYDENDNKENIITEANIRTSTTISTQQQQTTIHTSLAAVINTQYKETTTTTTNNAAATATVTDAQMDNSSSTIETASVLITETKIFNNNNNLNACQGRKTSASVERCGALNSSPNANNFAMKKALAWLPS